MFNGKKCVFEEVWALSLYKKAMSENQDGYPLDLKLRSLSRWEVLVQTFGLQIKRF